MMMKSCVHKQGDCIIIYCCLLKIAKKASMFQVIQSKHCNHRDCNFICTLGQLQWFFSTEISYIAPKLIYFHYLKKHFLDQSTQKKRFI